jgi:HSF-type DNA-binding
MDGATTIASLTLSQYNFPRTGKRGVPQQFPRRLYEMLEAEAFQLDASAEHPRVISWSDSGKAFRIYDASEFSATILPKYFRTKKFSSFQRNLNLVSVSLRELDRKPRHSHASLTTRLLSG